MVIISGTTHFSLEQETAVAIGKFDGLHIGHCKLLEEIIARKEEGLSACVFTFDPSPSVLFGNGEVKELMTREEKRVLLAQLGIDILIEFPLTKETAAILPEVFVSEILVSQMNARFIAAGEDVSFGAGGKGNAALLMQLACGFGYRVELIRKVRLGDIEISSTYVREQVEKGNMKMVQQLLGRPYTVIGKVVHGNRIGRTIGMPTVNQLPGETKLMPPNGVYYSRVLYNGSYYRGISNVGYKPTVTRERVLGIETHLYNFSEEIYGEEIQVELLQFKRPERKFGSLEELKQQMEEDVAAGAIYKSDKESQNNTGAC